MVLSWIFGLGQGQRLVVAVPPDLLDGLPIPEDSLDDPAASTAVPYENGAAISLSHRTVAAIAERGHSRLSHWGSARRVLPRGIRGRRVEVFDSERAHPTCPECDSRDVEQVG